MTKLITFEGVEGSGKSTQARLLEQYFLKEKIPAILTREPGGSKLAEDIRKLLVEGAVDKMDGICEMLLNFAARRDHLEKLIKPSLNKGEMVICDRFFDSTIAYQGFGQNVDLSIIKTVQNVAIAGFAPDITFLIDLKVDVAFERIKSRVDNNRYEKMDKKFHQKVREGFLTIAKNNQERFFIIDGNQSQEEIHQNIIEIVKNVVLKIKDF